VKDVAPAVSKLMEKMSPGAVSERVRVSRGYQLLNLETMTATQVLSLEQAREQISERVFTDKRKAEFQKYIQKLRAQAIIEWKNPDIRRAFEEGVKQQNSGVGD